MKLIVFFIVVAVSIVSMAIYRKTARESFPMYVVYVICLNAVAAAILLLS